MAKELTAMDEYLFKELEMASKLTFHIDELRHKVTSFFLSFIGIAGVAMSIIIKGEFNTKNKFFSESNLPFLLFFVAILGGIVIFILGRLRRSQIEHFRIINNIREHFLKKDMEYWNIVQLSDKTLPTPNHSSGTYFWTLLIIVVNSALVTLATAILLQQDKSCIAYSMFALIASLFVCDSIYFYSAQPPESIKYSQKTSPYK
jgi:hypothetical protein